MLDVARLEPNPDLTQALAALVGSGNDAVSLGALAAIGEHPRTYGAAARAVLAFVSVAPPARHLVALWVLERLAATYPGFIPVMGADRSPLVRLSAVKSAAARLGCREVGDGERAFLAQVVMGATRDQDTRVRERACMALGEYPIGGGTSRLRGALEDPSLRVKRAVIRALGRSGETEGQAALLSLLEVENPPLIADVLEALRSAPGHHAEAWIGVAYEGGLGRRTAAIRALGTLGDPSLCEMLLPLLNDEDKRIRRLTARSLASVAANAAPARPRPAVFDAVLRHFDSDQSKSAKEAMLGVLAVSHEPGVLQALRSRIATADPVMAEKLGEAANVLEESLAFPAG